MSEHTYLLVTGNGKTSRINVEALLNDYTILLKQQKQTPVLVLPFEKKPSEGQIWSAQHAKEKGYEIIAYGFDENSWAALPGGASGVISQDPYKDATKLLKGPETKVYGFLLWDDEDPACLTALATYTSRGISCYDLTSGLTDITPVKGLKAPKTPKVIEQENLSTEEEESALDKAKASRHPVGRLAEYPDLTEDEDESEYSEEEEELMMVIYDAMQTLAKSIAEMVLSEIKKK